MLYKNNLLDNSLKVNSASSHCEVVQIKDKAKDIYVELFMVDEEVDEVKAQGPHLLSRIT